MATKKQQQLMTPGDFVNNTKKKDDDGRILLTPGDFPAKLHIRVSKVGEKDEFIPKGIEPCKKCENVRRINETNSVRTGCYCSDILPANYLTRKQSDDDVYIEMSVEDDLPW